MKVRQLFLLFLFSLAATTISYAQQNLTLFMMHDLPQANFVNPAVSSKCKLVVGIPALASLDFNYSNTAFSAKDLLVQDGSQYFLLPQSAIDNLSGKELITTSFQYTPLYVGIWIKQSYLTFAITEKLNVYNLFNADVAQLAWYGNTHFLDESASLDGTRSNAFHFREYAFGIAGNVSPKVQMGFKTKVLFGKSAVYMPTTKGAIHTDGRGYDLDMDFSTSVYTSLPIDVTTDADGYVASVAAKEDISVADYLLNRQNLGLAIDYGMIYKMDERWTFSASLIDLGFINWQSDVNTFESFGQISYNGTGTSSDFGTAYLTQLADSLAATFKPKPQTTSFTSVLNPQIYLGASYNLTHRLNGAVVVRNQFYRNRVHPSLTLSANTFAFKKVNGSLSYTIQNGELMNLGAGIGAQLGVFHLHAITDNYLGFFDLSNTRNVNLRVGLSLIFGCEEKKAKKRGNGIEALPCVYSPYKNSTNNRPKRR